jgi:hypothetical protein
MIWSDLFVPPITYKKVDAKVGGDLNARKFKFPISEHDIYVFPLFQPRCSI